jgi:hypothetical protein
MSEDMRGMNDGQIQSVFSALGRIEQKIDGHTDWMKKHVEDDKLMAVDIKALQVSHARQKGFLTALTALGSVLGAGVGYAIDIFKSH